MRIDSSLRRFSSLDISFQTGDVQGSSGVQAKHKPNREQEIIQAWRDGDIETLEKYAVKITTSTGQRETLRLVPNKKIFSGAVARGEALPEPHLEIVEGRGLGMFLVVKEREEKGAPFRLLPIPNLPLTASTLSPLIKLMYAGMHPPLRADNKPLNEHFRFASLGSLPHVEGLRVKQKRLAFNLV